MLDFHEDNILRIKMGEVCAVRWCMEECNFHAMTSSDKNFHILGKSLAERQAQSPIYVVTDNDCLILGEKFVERGVEIMQRHPEYALLAATSISDGDLPSGSIREGLEEAIPRHAVGGVAFVRKGVLTDFAPCRPSQVDETVCHEIKNKGYKAGSMPGMRFNHIGAGYSLSSPIWWNRVPV